MNKALLLLFMLLYGINSFSQSAKVEIERNKLVSDITIKIENSGKELVKDKMFTLQEMGFEANSPGGFSAAKVSQMTEVATAMKMFKKDKVINYDIIIKNSRYPKPFYGKIAFFNVFRKSEMDAVARYREISIDESYFTSATRGRVAITYEYATLTGAFGKTAKWPTWIIMMSDEPF
ncbi:hypothetical protein VRU48_07635 [Pedobacter sp. KR3-3]|uniref:Uncharacterized protein n=1 Tax=Pedobacter albus TaxID=3113905 RepID=A0ABU7I683_9SPHI|nr:hypothetical protein [Pedobacter sp. KR3-3]MEE1944972.1 hypothetical protein [Pedobacter sp. KR3-3]